MYSSSLKVSDPDLILRKAGIHDLDTLLLWDQQPHVIQSDPNDDWNWETELKRNVPWREMLIAEINQRAVGFLQIIDPALEETHYWGEVEAGWRALDIWIGEESDLGKGIGTAMMRQAMDRCFASPEVKGILIDPLSSNTKAHRFYERLGFQFLEERTFDEDQCHVYVLMRPFGK